MKAAGCDLVMPQVLPPSTNGPAVMSGKGYPSIKCGATSTRALLRPSLPSTEARALSRLLQRASSLVFQHCCVDLDSMHVLDLSCHRGRYHAMLLQQALPLERLGVHLHPEMPARAPICSQSETKNICHLGHVSRHRLALSRVCVHPQ